MTSSSSLGLEFPLEKRTILVGMSVDRCVKRFLYPDDRTGKQLLSALFGLSGVCNWGDDDCGPSSMSTVTQRPAMASKNTMNLLVWGLLVAIGGY